VSGRFRLFELSFLFFFFLSLPPLIFPSELGSPPPYEENFYFFSPRTPFFFCVGFEGIFFSPVPIRRTHPPPFFYCGSRKPFSFLHYGDRNFFFFPCLPPKEFPGGPFLFFVTEICCPLFRFHVERCLPYCLFLFCIGHFFLSLYSGPANIVAGSLSFFPLVQLIFLVVFFSPGVRNALPLFFRFSRTKAKAVVFFLKRLTALSSPGRRSSFFFGFFHNRMLPFSHRVEYISPCPAPLFPF